MSGYFIHVANLYSCREILLKWLQAGSTAVIVACEEEQQQQQQQTEPTSTVAEVPPAAE